MHMKNGQGATELLRSGPKFIEKQLPSHEGVITFAERGGQAGMSEYPIIIPFTTKGDSDGVESRSSHR
jgi:hypothetical protein